MPISGLILAGGRSSRMGGNDKGLLLLNGQPLIEHAIQRLKPQVDDIIISANRHTPIYAQYGYPVVADEFNDFRGPLAGICQGLANCVNDYLLTIPCDGPLLPMDFAQRMLAGVKNDSKVLCAFDGQFKQPAYCLVHRVYFDSIRRFLHEGERKLGKWLMDNNAQLIDFSDQKDAFVNINTAEDLQRLQASF